MMRMSVTVHAIRLAAAALAVLLAQPAQAQTPPPASAAAPAASVIDQLVGSATPIEIDIAAIKHQAAERIQARTDQQALRRPHMAPQLDKLPHFDFEVVFDPDSSVIRPNSYAMIGRIADALTDPKLLPYAFLVVDHTESTGNRKENLALSQKRADSIRSVLSGTYKISAKRLFSLGLGEEQLRDAARPTSPANARAQVVTIGARPDDAPAPAATAPAAKKGAPAKKKRAQ
jgi:OOP family OmpA-OmpF porin